MKLSALQVAALCAAQKGQMFAHGRDGNVINYVDETDYRYFKPATIHALRKRHLVQLHGEGPVELTEDGASEIVSVSQPEPSTDTA